MVTLKKIFELSASKELSEKPQLYRWYVVCQKL